MKFLSYILLLITLGCSSLSQPKTNPDVQKYKLAGLWVKQNHFNPNLVSESYLRINCQGDLDWNDNEGISPFFEKRPWDKFNGTIKSIKNNHWHLTNCVVDMSLEEFVPPHPKGPKIHMSIHGADWILSEADDCPAG